MRPETDLFQNLMLETDEEAFFSVAGLGDSTPERSYLHKCLRSWTRNEDLSSVQVNE